MEFNTLKTQLSEYWEWVDIRERKDRLRLRLMNIIHKVMDPKLYAKIDQMLEADDSEILDLAEVLIKNIENDRHEDSAIFGD